MVRMLDYPTLTEAAVFRDALATHFDNSHRGIAVAHCCGCIAASCANALTRMRQYEVRPSRLPFAAAARAVSRVGVALFLLAAAERLGHAGLLSRIMSH
jgi:hypothetical protein